MRPSRQSTSDAGSERERSPRSKAEHRPTGKPLSKDAKLDDRKDNAERRDADKRRSKSRTSKKPDEQKTTKQRREELLQDELFKPDKWTSSRKGRGKPQFLHDFEKLKRNRTKFTYKNNVFDGKRMF